MLYFYFLSILSIKCGNWFYWADRAERAESKESPAFTRICCYFLENQRFAKMWVGRIPPSPPASLLVRELFSDSCQNGPIPGDFLI